MKTNDKSQTGRSGAAANKRAYVRPRLVELGDVRELTRGGGGSQPEVPFGGFG